MPCNKSSLTMAEKLSYRPYLSGNNNKKRHESEDANEDCPEVKNMAEKLSAWIEYNKQTGRSAKPSRNSLATTGCPHGGTQTVIDSHGSCTDQRVVVTFNTF